MEQIVINFAKNQKLPTGYRVEWWEIDELYRWVIDENTYSDVFANRWQAFRSAWVHFRYFKNSI